MRKMKYTEDLPRKMYTYFISFNDFGAPSFSKFARSIGATLKTVEEFRSRREFQKAYEECSEIRRDYLIDNALAKRFDASVTKFLLASEYGMDREDLSEDEKNLTVSLEVIDDTEAKK